MSTIPLSPAQEVGARVLRCCGNDALAYLTLLNMQSHPLRQELVAIRLDIAPLFPRRRVIARLNLAAHMFAKHRSMLAAMSAVQGVIDSEDDGGSDRRDM